MITTEKYVEKKTENSILRTKRDPITKYWNKLCTELNPNGHFNTYGTNKGTLLPVVLQTFVKIRFRRFDTWTYSSDSNCISYVDARDGPSMTIQCVGLVLNYVEFKNSTSTRRVQCVKEGAFEGASVWTARWITGEPSVYECESNVVIIFAVENYKNFVGATNV